MTFHGKDIAAGAAFMVLGLGAMLIARNYEMGTARMMGAGYFPTLLAGLLMAIGAVIFAQGLLSKGREAIEGISWRPLVLVTLAIGLFSLLIEPAGLVISVVLVATIGSYAGREARWREVAALTAGLVVFCALVFYYGVRLPITLLPV